MKPVIIFPMSTLDEQGLSSAWEAVLADIAKDVSKASLATWFKDVHIVKKESGVLFMSVPSVFYRDWLSSKYHKILLRAVREIFPDVHQLEYTISPRAGTSLGKEETLQIGRLPLSEHYVGRQDGLNPRYTFETFIVGPFNEVAHAATQAVVAEPGIAYNPLFIYGNTGYGKTHLIQAAGNALKQHNERRKIIYLTSERFCNDMVNALQTNTIREVKDRYRQYDVFIMDDVQFLSGKEKIQEELFHLFNALYEANKQILFSSDRHPRQIQNIADRLKSRFHQGMIVDINTPDLTSRIAILKAKAAQANQVLPQGVGEFIAERVESNIRDLEGILNRVIIEMRTRGRPLTEGELGTILSGNYRTGRPISLNEIVERVSEYYHLDKREILEKSRRREVVRPRQIVMYLMRERLGDSFPTIGEKLGGRDHSTVIHSYEKIRDGMAVDLELKQDVEELLSMLR